MDKRHFIGNLDDLLSNLSKGQEALKNWYARKMFFFLCGILFEGAWAFGTMFVHCTKIIQDDRNF